MSRTLSAPGGVPRMLAPTTTHKLAQRMLSASRVMADVLPRGFYGSPGLDILLAMYVAEGDAQYLSAGELCPPGSLSPKITERWIVALDNEGLVERRRDLLALTPMGYATVNDLIERVYAVQRALD